jgi:hypothetical protein
MTFVRNVAIVALLAGAYATNPEESTFHQFVEDEMKRQVIIRLERGR